MIENGEENVTKEDKEEIAKKLGIKYYDISCKWNLNIEEIMARIIFDCYKEKQIRKKNMNLNIVPLSFEKLKRYINF